MEIIAEVSNPHYHPGPTFSIPITKKRDLSVPPHWVANERIEKDGKTYAIVMPTREEELYEERQEIHIHLPEFIHLKIGDEVVKVKIKVHKGEFQPVMHFDPVDGARFGIKSGVSKIVL